MKRQALILAAALCVSAVVPAARAATTDSISVTVSLVATIEVDLEPNSWLIGPVQLSSVTPWTTFTAAVGNTAPKLEIALANPTGGLVAGAAPGVNTFAVEVDDPPMFLTTAWQVLAASAPPYGAKVFRMRYYAPTASTIPADRDQSFSILVRASAPI